MRSYILSFPPRLQMIFVPAVVVVFAFITAMFSGMFFDAHQLIENRDLISSVYQVMGTIYAILLTFTLWGVWQNYTKAGTAVQEEAYALLDLIHMVEAVPSWKSLNAIEAALNYLQSVIEKEWTYIKDIRCDVINLREQSHSSSVKVMLVVQRIQPKDERELAVFSQTLILLSKWLDARRTRILAAYGNTAKALWPLLITGALVLFALHGMLAAQTPLIWGMLMCSISVVIGLTFYLIFSLDAPFTGIPRIDEEPFKLAINILKNQPSNLDAFDPAQYA